MRDIAAQLLEWHAAQQDYVIASVIGIGGSAPLPLGAALAVDSGGTVIGSVSGGCVEGAVYELCRESLQSGTPARQVFGYSDSDAFAVGLTCGGTIEVFVHPITAADRAVVERVLRAAAEPTALVRDLVTGATAALGAAWTAGAEIGELVVAETRIMLASGATGVRTIGSGDSEVTVFVESHVPPPRMIVFGTTDFAGAITTIGAFLGYHVTVCDARPIFATRARFPAADEVVVEWPDTYLSRTFVDSRTVLCVLTHDPKFDAPLLQVALGLRVAYIGAMGSRRTHEERLSRLRAAGVMETELAQLRSPIGLDLGGRTPQETAVAVAAEFIALRHGASGHPLTDGAGPIHHRKEGQDSHATEE